VARTSPCSQSCPEIPDELIDCSLGRRRFNRCSASFELRKPVLFDRHDDQRLLSHQHGRRNRPCRSNIGEHQTTNMTTSDRLAALTDQPNNRLNRKVPATGETKQSCCSQNDVYRRPRNRRRLPVDDYRKATASGREWSACSEAYLSKSADSPLPVNIPRAFQLDRCYKQNSQPCECGCRWLR
jgi:hypothetical protein